MRPLVVVATPEEAAHVPPGLEVVVTGVGKTAAAVVTTEAILRSRPESVVNVGSAGALRPGLTGLFEIGTVVNHDMNADVIRLLNYDPQERLELGTSQTVLASGDVFVTDPAVRDRLADWADLVDMEGYAVAYACRRFDVPVTLVKHVSDQADESALDWPAVVDLSAQALGGWFRDHV